MTRLAIARTAAAAAVFGLLLAGCSDDDDSEAVEPSTDLEEVEPAATETEVIEVTAVDYGFEGLPATVPAGTRLSLANESPVELHELVAFRLPDDETRAVGELVTLPEAELLPTLGEPATVLLAPPGGEQIPAVGDGTLAEPGRYAIVCVIPTGADPAAYLDAAAESDDGPPDVPGGPPHIANGMFAELVVA
ncbi:hypothetical protein NHL50_08470 [Acidimicrobiia bacterium EGI L10123]|uniref:hypothetical protein n=1 Tax=Salinilacustrithrix flava TaxID=2957203 RepID=UPI003D7C14B0|nr:hypothetical protein [Acidimicrobiia bacterium EGI L10123]